MSEQLPVRQPIPEAHPPMDVVLETAGQVERRTTGPDRPLESDEFADYLDDARASTGTTPYYDGHQELRRSLMDTYAALEAAAAMPENRGLSPAELVQQRMAQLAEHIPPAGPDRRAYTAQWERLQDVRYMVSRPRIIRERVEALRAEQAAQASDAEAGAAAAAPEWGGMSEDAIQAAMRVVDGVKLKPSGEAAAPAPVPHGMSDEDIAAARAAIDSLNVSGGVPAASTKSQQPEAAAPAAGPEAITAESLAALSPDQLKQTARSYIDGLYQRYQRKPLTPDERKARMDQVGQVYSGDIGAMAQAIKSFALTTAEASAVRQLEHAMAPLARGDTKTSPDPEALALGRELGPLTDHTSLMMDNPDTLGQLLAKVGFRPDRITHYVGQLRTKQASQRPGELMAAIRISFNRDPANSDPAQGKILDDGMSFI